MDLNYNHRNWIGWTPYQQFIQRLTLSNPVLAAEEYHSPQNFHVVKAAIPYTNNPSRASSTFIQNLRYYPDANRVWVTMGGKSYGYAMSPRMLSQWLTSNSLGRYYNKHVKL